MGIDTNNLLSDTSIMEILLIDRTTGKNIIWATDSYSDKGEGYQSSYHISIEKIRGEYGSTIIPRAQKTMTVQVERSKDKAEVFTPSWICNKQNNLVDNAWFGIEGLFNIEIDDEQGYHSWMATDRVDFSKTTRSWKDYVRDVRMEITCGEVPYLASRYDSTTGDPICVQNRIGLIDYEFWY